MFIQKKITNILIAICSICYSCGSNEVNTSLNDFKDIIKISVDPINPGRLKMIQFEKYFKSWALIPLETNKEFLIGSVNRIIHHKDKYFILDRRSQSVFAFYESGKAAFKINNLGQGPGEWLGVIDFTIDDDKEEIILHTDRPSKLIYFDKDGKFIKEIETENYYSNLMSHDNKLYFRNTSRDLKNLLFVQTNEGESMTGFLPLKTNDILFENTGVPYPSLLNSKSLFFSLPYSNIVYECKNGTVLPKYGVDFGAKNISSDFFNKDREAKDLLLESYKKGYGFAISNFKEGKDYIAFSYAGNIMVIYDKKTKTSEAFNFIENKKGKIHFENYFANDGDDNCMMAVYRTTTFMEQMRRYKTSPVDWIQVPEKIKSIYASTVKSSNPLLIVYNFK